MTTPGWPTEPVASTPAAGSARPGRGLTVALIVIVCVTFVAAVASFVVFLVPVFGALTSATYPVPGQVTRHFDAQTYIVYVRTGRAGFGGLGSSSSVPATSARIVDREGTEVPAFSTASDLHITNSGSTYASALRFTPPTAGEYTVSVTGDADRFLVARDIEDTIGDRGGWIGATFLFGLLFVGFGIWLIVRLVRRGRKRQPAYVAAAPPGWYTDPGGSGALRYWDGARWTDHTS